MLGVKLLGGATSRDEGFIEGLPMKIMVRVVELVCLLPQIRNPQSELLLFCSCRGIAKLVFGLRSCQTNDTEK